MLKLLPDWRLNMLFFYTIPVCVLFIFALRWIHDSPRYLYSKDKELCLKNLNLIASHNNRKHISEKELKDYSGRLGHKYNYSDLFRYKS